VIGVYALANIGERDRTARIVALIAGAALAGIAALLGVFATISGAYGTSVGAIKGNDAGILLTLGISLTVAGVLGLLYLLPPVQRVVARVLPVGTGSPVVYITVVIGLLLLAQQAATQLQSSQPLTWFDLLAQDIPLFVLSFIGVGLFTRRSFRETVQRLALEPPPSRWWWVVAVVGVGVFIAIATGIEHVAGILTPSTENQVSNVTKILFSGFNNPTAIIFLGILAAVVEETLFRGALLPRFGIIVTAILFAALHTQYAITFASLEVFVLGLGLGVLRVRSKSTLPCIVTHAGYDIAVGFLSLIAK
jgi:uncharacterized protein